MTDDARRQIMMNRRRALASIGAVGAAGLAGCSSQGGESTEATETSGDGGDGGGEDTPTPTPKQQASGTLKFGQAKAPVELDPITLNDVPSSEVAAQVFSGLYTYDEQTALVPDLAKGDFETSKKSSDAAPGTRYTVEIKEEATFHNGDPVTAEDVKYTLEAPVEEETENAAGVNMIDTITAIDEKTVQIDLDFPLGPFKHRLARLVVPKSVREQDKEAFKTNPVGSGPFKFAEWEQGSLAKVERWDDYWGEPKALVEAVDFKPVKESTTRLTTLQNGDNQIVKSVPPKLFSTVKNLETASIQSVPGISYFYLAMNCKEGPTSSKKVREAIDYTFDMDKAVSNFVEPAGSRQYSPVPTSIAETFDFPVEEWKQIPHDKDIEKAKSMFDEAGVPTDYNWKIIVPPDDKREQIGITVSNGLKDAGFENVSVQRLDWGAFLDRYITGKESDYNMFTLGWAGLPDPNSFAFPLFGRTEDTLGVTNGTYYGANSQRGKDAAEQFKQARQSPDREERRQLYIEGFTKVLEDRAHLASYNLKNTFGVRDEVNDFLAHPVDQFHLSSGTNNVSLDQ
ncbi:ABC transporter substrate-binding protein [Halobaculum sp. MBLA0147]|uniref:ABC transporter substrate-binding protein n=1 Tax=Halobaculum sp. MBLA0147 TaxID=3079934 RepID=UPI0035257AFA